MNVGTIKKEFKDSNPRTLFTVNLCVTLEVIALFVFCQDC